MREALPLNLEAPPSPDAAYIRAMFSRMARRYDAFAWLTSFGQGQRWRRQTVSTLQPGMRVLDLGCGTGDLALLASRRVGAAGEVVGLDFSADMLRMARAKAEAQPSEGHAPLRWVQAGAEQLPLEGPLFDAVVSGFVLRNLYEHIMPILEGVRRSLKPGGQVRFLDLTEPQPPLLRALFRGYLLGPTGLYGALLFGRNYPIPYLPDSARRFWKAGEFAAALARAGFVDIAARPLLLGSVTLYHAARPQAQ